MQDIGIVFQIAILIMSVVIHEVSHGYMAEYLGDSTARYAGRLTLNPFKHLDAFGSVILPLLLAFAGLPVFGWAKPVPYNPYNLRNQKTGEGLVALAGPLSNISIALFFAVIIRFILASGTVGSAFLSIASLIVLINLVLALFNLVPIPPLDGSKILFSILPYRFAQYRVSLEKYSIFIFLFFIFFLWQYLTPAVFYLFSHLTGIYS